MNVSLGTFETTPEIRAAVNSVLDSGRLSYGPVSREYERQFAHLHASQHAVASNSGTSSLVVALQALKDLHGWADGNEVIVPAVTFVATINAVLHNRLTPVLVDVDPMTFNIDADQIENAVTRKTCCIMPVHLCGLPANMPAIREIARRRQLLIVEDSCEAMLAQVDHYPVGSWGHIACFSTYAAHLLVTGVGGLATTNDPDYATVMRSLVNHGIALDELPRGEQYDPTWLARKFSFTRIGHSFRITELEAAIGLAQLYKLDEAIQTRQRNAAYLLEQFAPLADRVRFQITPEGYTHSWMIFALALMGDQDKKTLLRHLRSRQIESRDLMPLTSQPCYRFAAEDYPVAAWLNRSGLYVGVHQGLTQDQLDYLADAIKDYFAFHATT